MKKRILLLLILLPNIISAQSDSIFITTDVKNVIYSLDFTNSKKSILDFVQNNNLRVQSQQESKTSLDISLNLSTSQYLLYEEILTKIGYMTSKNISSVSNLKKINDINLELKYLSEKCTSYSILLTTIEAKSPTYLSLWNEQKILEEKIFKMQRELIYLDKKENIFCVNLKLYEETTGVDESGVSFINMPGIEFSFLSIDSPKNGLSAQNYQGYFIKYMFTKGKSYADIGVYKNNSIGKTDSLAFSEMFLLGFGQDFYSRHLGRGKRNFLNLYSGYTVGGLLASSNTKRTTMIYLCPSIGIELYKNKYMIIDTKVNYFLPISDYNRNMRGISYNASINFVF